MAVPVTLMMTQLALWYQARPLQIGEEAVLALQLSADADTVWPEIRLDPSEAVEVTAGPVCAYSERTVVWNIVARQPGTSQLVFHVDDLAAEKELAVNAGFTRVSLQRPSWKWYDALLHPWEAPFRPDSAVQSIEIVYPERDSWTSGTNNWIVYWFGASMVAALCFRPWLNVNI
jgi:hypothetical protein